MWAVHLFFGLRSPLLWLSGGSQRAFGGVCLNGFAEFARKVRLHPPFLWEMIAGLTLSPNEFSKRHFQC
jgi:hypothetical protein